VTGLVLAVVLLMLAFAPLAQGADQPSVGALLAAVCLLGLTLLVLGCGAIGPSLQHHRRTGRYLIPAKGGSLRTRHAVVFWGFLGVFGSLGLWLMGIALKGLVLWFRGAL